MFRGSILIFWSLLTGLVMNALKLYLSQNGLAEATEGVFPWYFKVDFIGDILINFAAIGSFILYRSYFPGFIRTCYLLLIVLVCIAWVDSFGNIAKQPSVFYGYKGIGNFLNFGILFFAADTRYFPRILNFFYFLCFFILAASIVNIGKVGMNASRREFLLYLRDFVVFLMWVFPFYFLQDENKPTKNLINIGAFLLIIIVVLSSGSRSYLALSAIYIIYKFREQIRRSNGIVIIAGALILGIAAYYSVMESSLNSKIESAVDNLAERKGDDSRSDQLIDFLSQFDMAYLIQGVGPEGKWFWHSINDFYQHLDNQFLLIAWWAGLPTLLIYVIFLVLSLRSPAEINYFENIKGLKLIIFCWIAACMGFAIYCTACAEPYYYFISLLIGMNSCRYTELIEDETPDSEDEEAADYA